MYKTLGTNFSLNKNLVELGQKFGIKFENSNNYKQLKRYQNKYK